MPIELKPCQKLNIGWDFELLEKHENERHNAALTEANHYKVAIIHKWSAYYRE